MGIDRRASTKADRSAEETAYLEEEFFRLGTQYYIAGRFAFFAPALPVAGTLLHHAVEFYLKGCLCRVMSDRQLKNTLGHSLLRAWDEFKRLISDLHLSRFDETVTALDRFEDLRYPDRMLDGWAVWFMLRRGPAPSAPAIKTPPYVVVLNEVDVLVSVLFENTHASPRPLTPGFILLNLPPPSAEVSADAKIILTRDNPEAHRWAS